MGKPILFMVEASPAVRAVLMTAKTIGLELDMRQVDFLKQENFSPGYLKMNPQHTVPVLLDDGLSICDSHAIMPYIVEKYAKDDSLYPKDLKRRALVNQRLHFNNGVLYSKLLHMFLPVLYQGKNFLEDCDVDDIYKIYELLNTFLENNNWFAGDNVTIADYALFATVSSINVWIPIKEDNYPKLQGWTRRFENNVAEFAINKKGLEDYTKFYKSVLTSYPAINPIHIMAPKLYMVHPSPPVRAVLITAKAIGLELELKETNLLEKEQMTPEFLKMNPQHTVPTLLEEDGFSLWDSHAIIVYLITKYSKSDSLYPKDARKRAVIDQRLHFESGFFTQMLNILKPILYNGKKSIDQAHIEIINESYQFLNTFLEKNQWMAGDFVSIADYSLFASTTSIGSLIPIDSTKYPKLIEWIKRVENLPESQENVKGLEDFSNLFKSKLAGE